MGQDYVCSDSHFAMEVRMLKLLTQMLTLMTRITVLKTFIRSGQTYRSNVKIGQNYVCPTTIQNIYSAGSLLLPISAALLLIYGLLLSRFNHEVCW